MCPCHGSELTPAGEVLEGPARAPLRPFQVVEEASEVVVVIGGGGT